MTVAIANQKGGTGKTTTAVTIGAALAEMGRRVLIVDLDPQANATTALGVDYTELALSLADVLEGDCVAREACLACQTNLTLLPAHPTDLASVARHLAPERGDQLRIREILEPLAGDYDFIILDCPPALSLLTIGALIAADGVLVPVPTEFLSLEGVAQLLDTVDVVRDRFNADLHVLGLLAVRHEARTIAGRQVYKLLRDFGVPVFASTIRRSVVVSTAPGAGLPLAQYDPAADAARDYRAAAQEVLRCA